MPNDAADREFREWLKHDWACVSLGEIADKAREIYSRHTVATIKTFQLDCMTDMEGADADEFTEAEAGYNAAGYSAERLGLSPAAILFIDDKAANAEAARAVGMDALHFTGPGALRAALHARGLLEDTREGIAHAS